MPWSKFDEESARLERHTDEMSRKGLLNWYSLRRLQKHVHDVNTYRRWGPCSGFQDWQIAILRCSPTIPYGRKKDLPQSKIARETKIINRRGTKTRSMGNDEGDSAPPMHENPIKAGKWEEHTRARGRRSCGKVAGRRLFHEKPSAIFCKIPYCKHLPYLLVELWMWMCVGNPMRWAQNRRGSLSL
jgi:hypothetical protein